MALAGPLAHSRVRAVQLPVTGDSPTNGTMRRFPTANINANTISTSLSALHKAIANLLRTPTQSMSRPPTFEPSPIYQPNVLDVKLGLYP